MGGWSEVGGWSKVGGSVFSKAEAGWEEKAVSLAGGPLLEVLVVEELVLLLLMRRNSQGIE